MNLLMNFLTVHSYITQHSHGNVVCFVLQRYFSAANRYRISKDNKE